ncbi:unnamed protein product, partial [Heligmosomoides polygyrus]|uniref:Secreted protein n=1 Tax=Heligmosomoides polygyrus TaxID=6339 RepID=A0A183G2N4_HELPZ
MPAVILQNFFSFIFRRPAERSRLAEPCRNDVQPPVGFCNRRTDLYKGYAARDRRDVFPDGNPPPLKFRLNVAAGGDAEGCDRPHSGSRSRSPVAAIRHTRPFSRTIE